MGALLGLMLGGGLVLIAAALHGEGWHPRRTTTTSRLETQLRRAGVEGVTPAGIALLCVSSGLVAAAVMLAVSRTVPVAAAFGLLAPGAVARPLRSSRAR